MAGIRRHRTLPFRVGFVLSHFPPRSLSSALCLGHFFVPLMCCAPSLCVCCYGMNVCCHGVGAYCHDMGVLWWWCICVCTCVNVCVFPPFCVGVCTCTCVCVCVRVSCRGCCRSKMEWFRKHAFPKVEFVRLMHAMALGTLSRRKGIRKVCACDRNLHPVSFCVFHVLCGQVRQTFHLLHGWLTTERIFRFPVSVESVVLFCFFSDCVCCLWVSFCSWSGCWISPPIHRTSQRQQRSSWRR